MLRNTNNSSMRIKSNISGTSKAANVAQRKRGKTEKSAEASPCVTRSK